MARSSLVGEALGSRRAHAWMIGEGVDPCRSACRRFQRRPNSSRLASRHERKDRVRQGGESWGLARHLFHESRRQRPNQPDEQPRRRSRTGLVSGRHENRLYERPRRRPGDLSHERRRHNPTNLTNNPADDAFSTWSPDGTRIAFATDRPNGEIFTMNAGGSEQTNLTNDPSSDSMPAWSPTGRRSPSSPTEAATSRSSS